MHDACRLDSRDVKRSLPWEAECLRQHWYVMSWVDKHGNVADNTLFLLPRTLTRIDRRDMLSCDDVFRSVYVPSCVLPWITAAASIEEEGEEGMHHSLLHLFLVLWTSSLLEEEIEAMKECVLVQVSCPDEWADRLVYSLLRLCCRHLIFWWSSYSKSRVFVCHFLITLASLLDFVFQSVLLWSCSVLFGNLRRGFVCNISSRRVKEAIKGRGQFAWSPRGTSHEDVFEIPRGNHALFSTSVLPCSSHFLVMFRCLILRSTALRLSFRLDITIILF